MTNIVKMLNFLFKNDYAEMKVMFLMYSKKSNIFCNI